MDAKAQTDASHAPNVGKKRKKDGGYELPLKDGSMSNGPQSKTEDSGPSGAEMASTFLDSIDLPATSSRSADQASLTGVAKAAGRGMTILPAWMTSGDGPTMGSATTSSSVSAPSSTTELDGGRSLPLNATQPADQASLTGVAKAAGRGMTILPAWMTNKDGPSMEGSLRKEVSPKVSSPAAMVPKIHDPNHKEEVVAAVARSSGRGANLLPAWMTSGDGPTMGSATTSSSVSAPSSTTELDGGRSLPLNATQPADQASLTGVAKAAGRGMTILPAWMTNKDGPSMEGPLPSRINAVVDVKAEVQGEGAGEGDIASALKRRRQEPECKSGATIFGSKQYNSQLQGRIEEFLMSLVAEVVQDAKESNGGIQEKEAASMIKDLLHHLLNT